MNDADIALAGIEDYCQENNLDEQDTEYAMNLMAQQLQTSVGLHSYVCLLGAYNESENRSRTYTKQPRYQTEDSGYNKPAVHSLFRHGMSQNQ